MWRKRKKMPRSANINGLFQKISTPLYGRHWNEYFKISKNDNSSFCRIPNLADSEHWGIPEFCKTEWFWCNSGQNSQNLGEIHSLWTGWEKGKRNWIREAVGMAKVRFPNAGNWCHVQISHLGDKHNNNSRFCINYIAPKSGSRKFSSS